MKLKITKIVKLHKVMKPHSNEFEYKEGVELDANEIVEVKNISEVAKLNAHYAKKYGCDEVFMTVEGVP